MAAGRWLFCGCSAGLRGLLFVAGWGVAVVARIAWNKPIALNVTIDIRNGVSTPMEVTSMSYPDLTGANTPSQPQLIAPKRMDVGVVSGKAVLVPPNSYTVFVAKLR